MNFVVHSLLHHWLHLKEAPALYYNLALTNLKNSQFLIENVLLKPN